jgi:hypothetical protein
MNPKFVSASTVVAALVILTSPAFAGANDYAFEPVKSEVKKGDAAVIAVRLVHKPSGKPVSDAVIILTRIDMSPEGMETMAAPLSPLPSGEPGVYAFKTDLPMPGGWLFSVSAKVQGEPETVTGKVTFKATE